jgi:hypoxanthine phosphoribosyltransferase
MAPTPGARDVMDVDWPFFGEVCRALALHVSRDYDPEIVLGVAKAGVIPGVVVASLLQREFASMAVTRHDPFAKPQLIAGPPRSIAGRRVLIVDETCDSGDTLKLALNEVLALNPTDVRTAVSFRTGAYSPDFVAFETDKTIVLPWDREVVEDGAVVRRADLVDPA